MALPILRRGSNPISVLRGDTNIAKNAVNRIDPWNDFTAMDRLFENFFANSFVPFGRGNASLPQASEPTVEIYETADELLAYLYVPGMSPDSFDISASGESLTISAERKPLLEVTEGMTTHTPWSRMATGSSTFSVSYNLPAEIDPNKVSANYKEGVLSVRMPKSEAAKPRQVKIELGSTGQSNP